MTVEQYAARDGDDVGAAVRTLQHTTSAEGDRRSWTSKSL